MVAGIENGDIIMRQGPPEWDANCVCAFTREMPERLRWNLPRWHMSLIEMVGGLFGIFAIGLVLLLIYKSTLTMHEDDQLFLDDANSHMQEEQTELLTKVNRLTVPVRVFSIGSGIFLLVLVAMLIYQKLNEVQ
jgi:multisubunit Na+/H+ antiporter MnhB subunit